MNPVTVVDKAFGGSVDRRGSYSPALLDGGMPAEYLSQLIAVLVDGHPNLGRIRAADAERRGETPYDPRMMVAVLLYGYTVGVCSSRQLERKCADDPCFRWLAAGQVPHHRAVARFRRRHLAALTPLFVQALAWCRGAGVDRLGRVTLEGTTRGALAEEVLAMLADAERADIAEDATCREPAPATSNAWRALVGAVLAALMCAGGYAVVATKRVTLSVDGVSTTVSTMKSRVVDVLRDNGYAVGEHDEISPAADQSVRAADTIMLRRARPLQVSVDGRPGGQVWTTALTVGDALTQLSMHDVEPVTASRASRVPVAGMALPVVTPKRVRINDGGVVSERRLAAATVGRLLDAAGAPLQQTDRVTPPASTPVVAGMQIVVTRIRVHKVSERLPLPAPLRRIHDPSINISRRVVDDPGKAGTQDVTFAISTVNGRVTGRQVLDRKSVV